MYYCSEKSSKKMIHRQDCRCLKAAQQKEMIAFKTAEEAVYSGYSRCKCCSPIWDQVKKEKAELDRFCEENGLCYSFNRTDGYLDVYSKKDTWKIIVNGQKDQLFLYHKNKINSSEETIVPGYHSQKVRRASILGYFSYISAHDEYKMRFDKPEIRLQSCDLSDEKKHYKKMLKGMKGKVRKRKVWKRRVNNILNSIDQVERLAD